MQQASLLRARRQRGRRQTESAASISRACFCARAVSEVYGFGCQALCAFPLRYWNVYSFEKEWQSHPRDRNAVGAPDETVFPQLVKFNRARRGSTYRMHKSVQRLIRTYREQMTWRFRGFKLGTHRGRITLEPDKTRSAATKSLRSVSQCGQSRVMWNYVDSQ